MIECVWIRIKDGADPMEVLQRAQDGMGEDGLIIALKPETDKFQQKEGDNES